MAKDGRKSKQIDNIVSYSSNSTLKVLRIIDNLINTLDFQNKSEIGVSGILKQYWQCVSESETESKPKKSGENSAGPVLLLICFQMDTQYKNLKYPIKNLKYPIKPKRGG